jgi:hypothetical protein
VPKHIYSWQNLSTVDHMKQNLFDNIHRIYVASLSDQCWLTTADQADDNVTETRVRLKIDNYLSPLRRINTQAGATGEEPIRFFNNHTINKSPTQKTSCRPCVVSLARVHTYKDRKKQQLEHVHEACINQVLAHHALAHG